MEEHIEIIQGLLKDGKSYKDIGMKLGWDYRKVRKTILTEPELLKYDKEFMAETRKEELGKIKISKGIDIVSTTNVERTKLTDQTITNIVAGLSFLGKKEDEIATILGLPTEAITDLVQNVPTLKICYKDAIDVANSKVVMGLMEAILPGTIQERIYDVTEVPDLATNEIKQLKKLVKIVEKDYKGNVDGMLKWLQIYYPERFATKANNDLNPEEYGVLKVDGDDDDVDDVLWEKQTEMQQVKLANEMAKQKKLIDK